VSKAGSVDGGANREILGQKQRKAIRLPSPVSKGGSRYSPSPRLHGQTHGTQHALPRLSTWHWSTALYPEHQHADGHVAAQRGPSNLGSNHAPSQSRSLVFALTQVEWKESFLPGCSECSGPSSPSNATGQSRHLDHPRYLDWWPLLDWPPGSC